MPKAFPCDELIWDLDKTTPVTIRSLTYMIRITTIEFHIQAEANGGHFVDHIFKLIHYSWQAQEMSVRRPVHGDSILTNLQYNFEHKDCHMAKDGDRMHENKMPKNYSDELDKCSETRLPRTKWPSFHRR